MERWRQEMKPLKKSSHAVIMPHVDVKFNVDVQIILHKIVYGLVCILWIVITAWPS